VKDGKDRIPPRVLVGPIPIPQRWLIDRQREITVHQKGLDIDGVETYKTWGFGLMPPSVAYQVYLRRN